MWPREDSTMTLSAQLKQSLVPRITGFARMLIVPFFSFAMSGCSWFVIDTMDNKRLDTETTKKTRASETVTAADLYNDTFIGFALSGGGSRAANFSAAVMFELDDKLRILDKSTAIS